MTITLRNPHSVLAALEHRAHDVIEIVVTANPSPGWGEVTEQAKIHKIPVRTALAAAPKDRAGKSERQSGSEATVRDRTPVTVEQLFAMSPPGPIAKSSDAPGEGERVAAKGNPHGIWLALDCLQDPHNVGAVFRAAAFFGARGVIVTRDRSAPLTGTAYDVAAGGMESIPFAQPPNLARALEIAKKSGVWVLGSSEHAQQPLSRIKPDRPWLVVVGNEEGGLRRLTLELCDEVCTIPQLGPVDSLNVSVATGILLYALNS